jgi:hypothetical protein
MKRSRHSPNYLQPFDDSFRLTKRFLTEFDPFLVGLIKIKIKQQVKHQIRLRFQIHIEPIK